MSTTPTIAFFRPDDKRAVEATRLIESLGGTPLSDPMLEIQATGTQPRTDADYTVLTSKTGVDLLADSAELGGTVCAIGETTAALLTEAGYEVDIVPETYTSSGLVERLADEVDGARVEIARSSHGSPVLLDGLEAAGAYIHETILYRLVRPDGSGISTERAAAGRLDGVLFSSSLTVEHFIEAADERGIRADALSGLDEAVVGVIGAPTKATAEAFGIDVDVVPEDADFEQLANAVIAELS